MTIYRIDTDSAPITTVKTYTATTISFVASDQSIRDSANGLGIFNVGDYLRVFDTTNTVSYTNQFQWIVVTKVSNGHLIVERGFSPGTLMTNQSAGPLVHIETGCTDQEIQAIFGFPITNIQNAAYMRVIDNPDGDGHVIEQWAPKGWYHSERTAVHFTTELANLGLGGKTDLWMGWWVKYLHSNRTTAKLVSSLSSGSTSSFTINSLVGEIDDFNVDNWLPPGGSIYQRAFAGVIILGDPNGVEGVDYELITYQGYSGAAPTYTITGPIERAVLGSWTAGGKTWPAGTDVYIAYDWPEARKGPGLNATSLGSPKIGTGGVDTSRARINYNVDSNRHGMPDFYRYDGDGGPRSRNWGTFDVAPGYTDGPAYHSHNTWTALEMHYKFDSKPGARDGVLEGWIYKNGWPVRKLVYQTLSLNFRTTLATYTYFTHFWYATHFGGSSERWATTKEERILITKLAIADEPINIHLDSPVNQLQDPGSTVVPLVGPDNEIQNGLNTLPPTNVGYTSGVPISYTDIRDKYGLTAGFQSWLCSLDAHFATAMQSAKPGDLIILRANVSFTAVPITVPNIAIISDDDTQRGFFARGSLTISADNVLIAGVNFIGVNYREITITGSSNVRISRCIFRSSALASTDTLFNVKTLSSKVTIDHNLFADCTSRMFLVDGTSTDVIIRRNTFFRGTGDMVGRCGEIASDRVNETRLLLEYNRFKDCPDNLEINTSNNTVRYNYWSGVLGGPVITFRAGIGNKGHNNYIQNCDRGWRVFDTDGELVNNIFENIGDAANSSLQIPCGVDIENPPWSVGTCNNSVIDQEHPLPIRWLIANNTFIGFDKYGIEVGRDQPEGACGGANATDAPRYITITGNYFYTEGGTYAIYLRKTGTGNTVDSNAFTLSGGAADGSAAGVGWTDSNRVDDETLDALWTPKHGSAIVNGAPYFDALTEDIFGQPRDSLPDIGAVERITKSEKMLQPVGHLYHEIFDYKAAKTTAQANGDYVLVSSQSELQTAIDNAAPGRFIELAYNAFGYTLDGITIAATSSGSQARPIVFDGGGTTISDSIKLFTIFASDWIITHCHFETCHTVAEISGAKRVRITNSNFSNCGQTSNTPDIIRISGQSHDARIDGNTFFSSKSPCVNYILDADAASNGPSTNVRVEYNTIQTNQSASAAFIIGDDRNSAAAYTVTNFRLDSNHFKNFTAPSGVPVVSVAASSVTIVRNLFDAVNNEFVMRRGQNRIIERNWWLGGVYDRGVVQLQGIANVVRANIMQPNSAVYGIFEWGQYGARTDGSEIPPTYNAEVYHNSIRSNGDQIKTALIFLAFDDGLFTSGTVASGGKFKNNMLIASGGSGACLDINANGPTITGYTYDYNIYVTNQGTTEGAAYASDSHAITTDPQLNKLWEPANGGSAYNAGTTLPAGNDIDFYGQTRSGTPDIGAVEYGFLVFLALYDDDLFDSHGGFW